MPVTQALAGVHSVTISDRTELAPGVVLLGIHAPELARVTRPGQFVMAIPPGGERAAVALGIYEAEGDRASLLFFVCGTRTRELADLHVGEGLDLTGPLGNGFDLSTGARRVAIVAGGVGIASVLLPAQALIRAGSHVRVFYGARTAGLLVERERFQREGCEVICATDDGSYGQRGFVTQLVAQSEDKPDLILACGPSPMLRATAAVARDLNVRAQLSLEETFACGVGACWGCVVALDRDSAQAPAFPGADRGGSQTVFARICKEGPVFWADELRW
ncbi:MAG: dihydroorotate dehydrogenase electron transfer subunit [Candidatus Eremiobacteraeota bacterium]|nr:dihydroorotate dehydrogenase electron transfer subunit [Candidatus Eremiobacteraeota bacterium]